MSRWWCPQCNVDPRVDEDGCCTSCGATCGPLPEPSAPLDDQRAGWQCGCGHAHVAHCNPAKAPHCESCDCLGFVGYRSAPLDVGARREQEPGGETVWCDDVNGERQCGLPLGHSGAHSQVYYWSSQPASPPTDVGARAHAFADCKACVWKDGMVKPCGPHSLISLSEADLAKCVSITKEEIEAAMERGRREREAYEATYIPGRFQPFKAPPPEPASPPTDVDRRLDEVRGRAEKATPGPWDFDENSAEYGGADIYQPAVGRGPRVFGVNSYRPRDMAFVKHAREDIPWLLDLVDELRRR